MRSLVACATGGLFGLGLLISGMTDTTKVQGWLDIFGAWDPTLAFVLGGAIIPMFIAWRIAEHRTQAAFGGMIPAKPEPRITPELAIGSSLFGIGWGLSGLCPGPAMASLGFGGWPSLVFFTAMAAAMAAQPHVTRSLSGVR